MTDLRKTVSPKSDQLNADDLRGISKVIKVTKVSLLSEADQPIAINYEGDEGKPYKPCKSMRRVLVNVWGSDGSTYTGRIMKIYCDDKVMFGGLAVGGIRISHMSHIDKDVTMAITATRASRKPYTVKPLVSEPQHVVDIEALKSAGENAAKSGRESFLKWFNSPEVKPHQKALESSMESFKVIAQEADLKQKS